MVPTSPWLLVYLVQSWQNPAFRYVLLVLPVVGHLMVTQYEEGCAAWSRRAGAVLSMLGGAVALIGAVANSPWLVWVGVVMMSALVFSRWRRTEDGREAWPLWVYLFLSIRPPASVSESIVEGLQRISTQVASGTLDLLHVLHYRAGNVLETPGKQFMVEEACSGVQSIFTLAFIAATMSIYYRRSLPQTVVLLLSSIVWAGAMNVIRILAVVLAFVWWQVDLSEGWRHSAVGYLALGMAILLLLSSDRLIYLGLGPIRELEEDIQPGRALNPLLLAYNRWIGGGVGPWYSRLKVPRPLSVNVAQSLPSRALLITCCAFATMIAFLGTPTLWGYRGTQIRTHDGAKFTFTESQLPEAMGAWKRNGYGTDKRRADSSFGQHSSIWHYEQREMRSRVSLDYHFSGWHELMKCYEGIGWKVLEHRVIEATDSDSWPIVAVLMRDASGGTGMVYYSLFDLTGKPLMPNSDAQSTVVLDRLRWLGDPPVSYQVQLFVSLPTPPDGRTSNEMENLHRESREALRRLVLDQGGVP